MKGRDLRCDCGAGAKDVAPDLEFDEDDAAIQWTCQNSHLLISGWRDGFGKPQQMRFTTPQTPPPTPAPPRF